MNNTIDLSGGMEAKLRELADFIAWKAAVVYGAKPTQGELASKPPQKAIYDKAEEELKEAAKEYYQKSLILMRIRDNIDGIAKR